MAGFVKIWHYPTKSCLYTIHDKQIEPLTIDFNKSCDRMAVGGYHEKIKIYDLHTKALVNTLENKYTFFTINLLMKHFNTNEIKVILQIRIQATQVEFTVSNTTSANQTCC